MIITTNMKKIYYLLSLVGFAITLNSCSNQEEISPGNESYTTITASIPPFEFEDGTRAVFSDNFTQFSWEDNDQIRLTACTYTKEVGYDDYFYGASIYTLLKGGGAVGSFQNLGFKLKPNDVYYAWYPIGEYTGRHMQYPSLKKQTQSENADFSHIHSNSVLRARIETDENGEVPNVVSFEHLCSLFKMDVVVDAGTYIRAEIQQNYPVAYYIYLMDQRNNIGVNGRDYFQLNGWEGSTFNPSVLNLGNNGFTLNEKGTLTLYMLFAPVFDGRWGDASFELSLYDDQENVYKYTFGRKQSVNPTDIRDVAIKRGKAYQFTPELVKE